MGLGWARSVQEGSRMDQQVSPKEGPVGPGGFEWHNMQIKWWPRGQEAQMVFHVGFFYLCGTKSH